MTRRRDCLMTPHFLIGSFGPKIGSVDGICHQTDSMNRFYLGVKTGPKANRHGKTAHKKLQHRNVFISVLEMTQEKLFAHNFF